MKTNSIPNSNMWLTFFRHSDYYHVPPSITSNSCHFLFIYSNYYMIIVVGQPKNTAWDVWKCKQPRYNTQRIIAKQHYICKSVINAFQQWTCKENLQFWKPSDGTGRVQKLPFMIQKTYRSNEDLYATGFRFELGWMQSYRPNTQSFIKIRTKIWMLVIVDWQT
jgi:hypothetical protein